MSRVPSPAQQVQVAAGHAPDPLERRGSEPLEALQLQADKSATVARVTGLQDLADRKAGILQAVFHPASTTATAHLRNDGAWGRKRGRKIASGTEIVADRAATRTQDKRDGSSVSWTKAVNVRPQAWNDPVHSPQTTYIRTASLGADLNYPATDAAANPPGRALIPEKRWSLQTGEYIYVEPSVSVDGTYIIKQGASFWRVDLAGARHALDEHERRQVDGNVMKAYVKTHVRDILSNAASGRPWKAEFEKDENIEKLAFAQRGSKALRYNEGMGYKNDKFVAWYKWLPGPFQRIFNGAVFTVAALDHWREWLYPAHPEQVIFDDITFSGSDLHEEGLGAIFLTVNKPGGVGAAPYQAQTSFRLVFKSEEKELERDLFGAQGGSLAEQVNTMAGLGPDRMVKTFNMQTERNCGSLIEMVQANQLDRWGDDTQPANSAMREALVFCFMTGLSDLHYENVLWDDAGMPYFIDADNALNNGRLNFTSAGAVQGGFNVFNRDEAVGFTDKIQNDEAFGSQILAALRENDRGAAEPVLRAVRDTFAGKNGRAVPLFTQTWGGTLSVAIGLQEGLPGHGPDQDSRWGRADKFSGHVEDGYDTGEPGLVGETGVPTSGRYFNKAEEKRQIKRDFDRGQIPFYVYYYDTGLVKHNDQTVWRGKPLAEALQVLFQKFPGQPN